MTESRIEIRTAGPAEVDELLPLFEGYRAFYGQAANPARSRAFLHGLLHNQQAHVLLATIDHKSQGFALLYPLYSSVRCGALWLLNDLFVAPAARQHGIGKALLDACAEFGRATGALGLQLETQRTNTIAQALYLEQGWEADEDFCTYHLPLADPS